MLRARWNELNQQIRSQEAARDRIVERMNRTGDATARAGLNERLNEVDKRILQLDADRAEVGRQIAASGPELVAGTEPPTPGPPINRSNDEGPWIVLSLLVVFVLAPISLAFTRRIWKRTPKTPTSRQWNDMPLRMEKLEHAVDAVAIEVERISEGQRFVTRLMTENELRPAMAAVRASADAARDVAAQPAEGSELKALGPGERPFEPVKATERDEARLREGR